MTEMIPVGVMLAHLADLPDGASREFVLGEGSWPPSGFLVRVGDAVHAYLNKCPHALRPLNFLPDRFLSSDGELIQCTAHGALFEKDTGLCIAGPCVDESLRRIAITVRDGQVLLAETLDVARLERWPRQ